MELPSLIRQGCCVGLQESPKNHEAVETLVCVVGCLLLSPLSSHCYRCMPILHDDEVCSGQNTGRMYQLRAEETKGLNILMILSYFPTHILHLHDSVPKEATV